VAVVAVLAGAGVGDDPFAGRLVAAALLLGVPAPLHVAAEFGLLALLLLAGFTALLGHAPAHFLALAALVGDLLAAFARPFGFVFAPLGLAFGLLATLLFDALGHALALARLLDVQGFAALLLLLALRVAPVLVALRFVVARLALFQARRLLALFLALVALLLACGTAVVIVLVVVPLLRERGCDAAHGEQRAEQGGGQGAGSGKAGHLFLLGARPIRARWEQLAVAWMNRC